MSETALSRFKDEQDGSNTKSKILKSNNPLNPDSDI